MPIDLDTALKTVDRLGAYERSLLGRLVAQPSVRGEVSAVHEVCASELRRLGMDVEFVAPQINKLEGHSEWCPPHPEVAEPDKMVSVLGSWGEGPGIFLFAHIDTEPPGPLKEWRTDPFQATEIDGRVYGLGTADDKAGVVSVLAAVRALVPQIEGVRVVVGLVHGKLGGGLGTLPVVLQGGEVDAAIYCHPAETGQGMRQIKVASRGYFNFRITAAGRRPEPAEIRTSNSEDPREGVNAYHRLRAVLDTVERWAEQQEGVLCSVNRVSAGIDAMVLPEHAVAEGAFWFRSGTAAGVYADVSRVATEAGASSTEMFGLRSNPAQISAEHPLVTATSNAIMAETGAPPGLYPAHVASDIRFPIRCLQVPTVGFGCRGGNFYGPNEWVDAEDLHCATRVLVRTVAAWAVRASKGDPRPNLDSG